MKNVEKLNLNDLKVSSFVTSLEGKDSQTVKGGVFEIVILAGIAVASAIAVGTVVKAVVEGDFQIVDAEKKKK